MPGVNVMSIFGRISMCTSRVGSTASMPTKRAIGVSVVIGPASKWIIPGPRLKMFRNWPGTQ